MKRKILVTGAGSLCGQGIIRSLRMSSLDCEVIAVDPSPLAVGIHWADRGYIVPIADAPKYMNRIMAILEGERPDILMIGTDEELMQLSTRAKQIESLYGCKVLVSHPRVISICRDKFETFKWLQANGFNPPKTCLLKDAGNEMTFPFIVKPRIGGRSRGIRKIEWWGAMDRLVKDVDPMDEGWIAQEFIDGPEYTAGVLEFSNVRSAAIIMRRELRDGNTYRAFVLGKTNWATALKCAAFDLGVFGPCNMQFRVSKDGYPRIFEINPRFSGTTPLRALAGFNEVEMCVRHMLDGEPIHQPQIKPMTILRHWSEIVIDEQDIAGVIDEPFDANAGIPCAPDSAADVPAA